MGMKLSHLAKCIKILEELKWAIPAGVLDDKDDILKRPKEFYLIKELPFCSAFCYMFRQYQRKGSDGEGQFNCFCPRWNDGNNCGHNDDGNRKPEFQILDEVRDIPISTIMKYLSKIPLSKHQDKLRKLQSIWYINVRFMTDEWLNAPDSSCQPADIGDE